LDTDTVLEVIKGLAVNCFLCDETVTDFGGELMVATLILYYKCEKLIIVLVKFVLFYLISTISCQLDRNYAASMVHNNLSFLIGSGFFLDFSRNIILRKLSLTNW